MNLAGRHRDPAVITAPDGALKFWSELGNDRVEHPALQRKHFEMRSANPSMTAPFYGVSFRGRGSRYGVGHNYFESRRQRAA